MVVVIWLVSRRIRAYSWRAGHWRRCLVITLAHIIYISLLVFSDDIDLELLSRRRSLQALSVHSAWPRRESELSGLVLSAALISCSDVLYPTRPPRDKAPAAFKWRCQTLAPLPRACQSKCRPVGLSLLALSIGFAGDVFGTGSWISLRSNSREKERVSCVG